MPPGIPGKPPPGIPGKPPMPGIPAKGLAPPAMAFFIPLAIARPFMPGIFPIIPMFCPRPSIICFIMRNF